MDQPEVQHERKRRKWDVPGPAAGSAPPTAGQAIGFTADAVFQPPAVAVRPGQPPGPDAIKRAQEAALAVVSKLNKESVAKGLIPAARLASQVEEKKEICREVVINDAPNQIRYHLTRRGTQEDIQRRTATVIVTRGTYCPPGAKLDERDKPLHLRILPGAGAGYDDASKERAVEAAAAEVQRQMRGDQGSSVGHHGSSRPGCSLGGSEQVPYGRGNRAVPGQQPVSLQSYQAKLPIGLQAPPEFGLASRLQGPDGCYLQHIMKQTGVTVVLQGQGSGGPAGQEPLHMLLTSTNSQRLEEAKSLAGNLIDTVRTEYYRRYPAPPAALVRPPATPPPYPLPAAPQPPMPPTAATVSYPTIPPYPQAPAYARPPQPPRPPYFNAGHQYYTQPPLPASQPGPPPAPMPAVPPGRPPYPQPYGHPPGNSASTYAQVPQQGPPGGAYAYPAQQPLQTSVAMANPSPQPAQPSAGTGGSLGKRRFREFAGQAATSQAESANTLAASSAPARMPQPPAPPVPPPLPPLPPDTADAHQVTASQGWAPPVPPPLPQTPHVLPPGEHPGECYGGSHKGALWP
ncbi:unnamed protein product [Ostreobium quekettii]|uniref:Protein RIK n=1 Tax=Ostreobium quekettii TaxID=121088 RepID=A0A8S1ILW3_9CHLO|nr:unnamed protein product [Ostreobium quekettii]